MRASPSGTSRTEPVKTDILSAIRANRPAPRPHPGSAPPRPVGADPAARFVANSAKSYSQVLRLAAGESLAELLEALDRPSGPCHVRLEAADMADLRAHRRFGEVTTADAAATTAELAGVTLAVLRGGPAVIENGAVWVDERDMGHRALPYACEHLVLIVEEGDLVETMHEAYAQIAPSGRFGCFIAGPSKTADIEQSLVIGAQGPRSLVVVMRGKQFDR